MERLDSAEHSDFVEWARHTSQLLLERRFQEIDVDRLAEEVRDLELSQRCELISRLRVILMHLIKLRIDPGAADRESWRTMLRLHRRDLLTMLELSPSLRNEIPPALDRLYQEALEDVVDGASLEQPGSLPAECPFSADQVLDLRYVPSD